MSIRKLSVYPLGAAALLLGLACTPVATAQPTQGNSASAAISPLDETLVQAREALRLRNTARLLAARDTLTAARHPLASWADYWELNHRLAQAQQAELDAFYARWPGTYVEDRLRNDWLLELGKRRDWANLRTEFPRFRMNDDREVTCFWLLARHQEGADVRDAALAAWRTQRDGDDGCPLLGQTLMEAGVFKAEDAWETARVAIEFGRLRAARVTAGLISPAAANTLADMLRDPARFLNQRGGVALRREVALLGLMRLAAGDPDAAAAQLEGGWQGDLNPTQAATAWAHVARHAAQRQNPDAVRWADQAWKLRGQSERTGHSLAWSDDVLAWHVRAALRLQASDDLRWPLAARAIGAMSADEQRDSAWVFWRARAALALAPAGTAGDETRAVARGALQGLTAQTGFYPKLATEELGLRVALPPAPAPLTAAERQAARQHPGLSRALQLIDLGLRSEGVREWNFSLRGMSDRELLAAAQRACDSEVWDRCINTSERTRGEIDMAQRFPTPHRDALRRTASQVGLEPALMYGLIRQESRFIDHARSHVGASGLMQLMPATASWTARRIGLKYDASMINDREVNLRLGATYLKLVLDDFGGSQAMATAAYNAGPGRPRRWREGPPVEAAAWAESIPFAETRDYVKKVLSNAVYYTLLMNPTPGPGTSLRARLGPPVGPRAASAPASDTQLP
jgi:soluble lytic murein transglycosylase